MDTANEWKFPPLCPSTVPSQTNKSGVRTKGLGRQRSQSLFHDAKLRRWFRLMSKTPSSKGGGGFLISSPQFLTCNLEVGLKHSSPSFSHTCAVIIYWFISLFICLFVILQPCNSRQKTNKGKEFRKNIGWRLTCKYCRLPIITRHKN